MRSLSPIMVIYDYVLINCMLVPMPATQPEFKSLGVWKMFLYDLREMPTSPTLPYSGGQTCNRVPSPSISSWICSDFPVIGWFMRKWREFQSLGVLQKPLGWTQIVRVGDLYGDEKRKGEIRFTGFLDYVKIKRIKHNRWSTRNKQSLRLFQHFFVLLVASYCVVSWRRSYPKTTWLTLDHNATKWSNVEDKPGWIKLR